MVLLQVVAAVMETKQGSVVKGRPLSEPDAGSSVQAGIYELSSSATSACKLEQIQLLLEIVCFSYALS